MSKNWRDEFYCYEDIPGGEKIIVQRVVERESGTLTETFEVYVDDLTLKGIKYETKP